jgi:hypothetical protein
VSAFAKIRTYPQYGARTAVVTWTLGPDATAGDVYVAFSTLGTKGTWTTLNPDTPVDSAVGMYSHTTLDVNITTCTGYYRLLLIDTFGTEFLSPAVAMIGDITPREYGMVRAALWSEFRDMRVARGYPVWHCIPRTTGTPSPSFDPDTEVNMGLECVGVSETIASYGLPFVGGFNEPILTWIRPLTVERGTLKDSESEASVNSTDTISARMLAFPQPSRGHMIVDPASDRRYLVGDEVKPFLLRGVVPIAYETELTLLTAKDPRYRFPLPSIDTQTYRKF